MPKSVVSIVKGEDAEKMVKEALDHLGGVSSLIKPDSVVVVKPNSIGNLPPERGTSTNPAILGAVIKEISKANPKEIIMAEGVRGEGPENFEINGHKKAAEEAGARVVNIRGEKDLIDVAIRDHTSYMDHVLLPRFLIEADHVVNVPIFKTHVSMDFTCALKNMKGIVQGPVQAEMHIMGKLADSMMDLWSVCKADLQIADMTRPTEGYGPLSGTPTDFGCVVAGKYPVSVDATCCRMVGLDMDRVPYWDQARERGLGEYAEDQIEIRGKQIKEVFKQLWIPYLDDIVEGYPEYKIINGNACSMCEGLVAYSLHRIKALGEYDKNAGMTIVLGPDVENIPEDVDPKELIIFGDCAKKFRDKGIVVEGCPPGENEPAASIMDRVYNGFGPGDRDYFGEIAAFLQYMEEWGR